MIFQTINIFNLIILSLSVVFFIFSLILRIFKLNGFFIIFCSIIIYFISIFFKNLFLQFFGASVLFIFYFLFVYYFIIYIFYKNKKLEFISIHDGIIHALEKVLLKIEAKKIPINFPCIFFELKFDVYEKGRRVQSITEPVSSYTRMFFTINTIFDRHGRFNLKNFNFIFRDIFGLTKYSLTSDFESLLIVYPYFSKAEKIPFFLDKGGEEVIQSVVKVNSTDFFENRKYYPGDDTRRINWKIFARSGELHIREVEKIPPKIGQISILYSPYSKNFYEYEYITSLFLSTVNFLLKYSFQIKIFCPNNPKGILIDNTKEKEFNNIVNNSYDTIVIDSFNKIENSVIFSSFEEYKKILKQNKIKKSFSIVTVDNEEVEQKTEILKLLFNVFNYDGLIKEIIHKLRTKKKQSEMEEEIKKVKKTSIHNKIDLKLYKVGNEIN